ncbi:MAG: hypothetical protein ACE5EQ_03255 [Phycisphaerae bacterium]
MRHIPNEEDGKQALRGHVCDKAAAAYAKYGPSIDWDTFQRMLDDPLVVRYPTTIVFDSQPLEPGEFAFVQPRGGQPAEGFQLFIHPHFRDRSDALPLLIAYHLVRVNYGEIATHEEAELFGATLLGLEVDAYYQSVCRLADELLPSEPRP